MVDQSKNIILCADGTGNRGGETPDTNVYRMYQAVELHEPKRRRQQITYYDNGVGTDTNKYIRALSGALGFGFRDNVKGLYEFLARHYNHGDLVYLFGFSRGAATVRAFGGMLQECGLVDRNHPDCQTNGKFDYDKLVALTDEAYLNYQRETGSAFKQKACVIDEVRIKFMGIWDTVSALGFPYHRTGDSVFEDILERPLPVWLALACDRVLDFGPFAHRFYNYTPNKIVDHVYHAIAMDDERKSFLPRVWDEKGQNEQITQVWFAGMHSDVGGSYNQTGLAYVTMVWMMERAGHHGLDFVQGALQDAKDKANVHGRLHNSRDGLAIYYRYAPRDIEALCAKSTPGQGSKLNGRIKIHQSVIDRMDLKTDRYAPGLLPTEFEIVNTPIPRKNENELVVYETDSNDPVDPHVVDAAVPVESKTDAGGWQEDRMNLQAVVRDRRRLYRIFADFSFVIVLVVIWLWNRSGQSEAGNMALDSASSLKGHIQDVLSYFLPKIFDPFIQEAVVNRPAIIVFIVLVFVVLFVVRSKLKKVTTNRSVAIREKVVASRCRS